MCIITQITFSCGCRVDKETMICGYQDDDLSMCMDLTDIHDATSPGECGGRSCRGVKPEAEHIKNISEPLKTQTLRVDVHEMSDSGSESPSPLIIAGRDGWLSNVESKDPAAGVISSAAPPTSIVPPV